MAMAARDAVAVQVQAGDTFTALALEVGLLAAEITGGVYETCRANFDDIAGRRHTKDYGTFVAPYLQTFYLRVWG